MFIHLGGDTVVPKEEVIAILSLKLVNKADINREFMVLAEEEGFISNITDNAASKSFIITTKKIFLSPISPSTLKKRSKEEIDKNERQVKDKPW